MLVLLSNNVVLSTIVKFSSSFIVVLSMPGSVNLVYLIFIVLFSIEYVPDIVAFPSRFTVPFELKEK